MDEKLLGKSEGEPKDQLMVCMSRGLRMTPRFLLFTEIGKMAVETREHINLKSGFGCFKFQMPFKHLREDTE